MTITAMWRSTFTLSGGAITGLTDYGKEKNYTSIVLPSEINGIKITSIGEDAFYDCSSLTSIEIPDSITSIDDDAFFSCSSLTSVTIGANVTSIGSYAFGYCDSLIKVNYTGTIDSWVQIEFASNPLSYAGNLYINNELVTQANITTATKINSYAFYECYSLTSVAIGASVTSIGDGAFKCCDSLISVTIGENVRNISEGAFEYCFRLVEVYNKSSLGITKGSYTYGFVGAYALNIYTDKSGIRKLATDSNGYIIYTDGEDKILVGYVGDEIDLTLPNKITEIYRAFSGYSSLISIEIPSSVTSIGVSAFSGCSSLISIEIPNSVTSIGASAFSGCTSLTSIEIPNSVTSIGGAAFSGCDSLISIVIPEGVTHMGERVFVNCGELTIYCEAKFRPTSWSSNWNKISDYTYNLYDVVWGYTG